MADEEVEKALAEIEGYLAKMTPGPWEAFRESSGSDNFAASIYREDYKGLLIARSSQNGTYGYDAWGIAKLRTDAEWLIKELKSERIARLAAERERDILKSSLETYWIPTAKNEERLKLHWQERFEKLREGGTG